MTSRGFCLDGDERKPFFYVLLQNLLVRCFERAQS